MNAIAKPTARSIARTKVNMRVPVDALAVIDRGVEATHTDRTAFMVAAAVERATEALLAQTSFMLPAETFDAFVAALDSPRPVNAKARAVMRLRSRWAD